MDWIWFILLALIPNLLGHTLFNWSIKYVSTNVVSIAILFEPVGAALLALVIFKEYLIMTQIIGGLIVLAGILLFVIDIKKIFNFYEKCLIFKCYIIYYYLSLTRRNA